MKNAYKVLTNCPICGEPIYTKDSHEVSTIRHDSTIAHFKFYVCSDCGVMFRRYKDAK